tara:strand:+ start:750 stop:1688 length:939 start_codon:yes stop_codon:yes gene_type:complete
MTTLHVYSNRHIKDQVKTIKLGDWVYLENSMSRKRWSQYFSVNNINENVLNITYITKEEYFELSGIKFDVIVGNPPYSLAGNKTGKKGRAKNLYPDFYMKAVELADNVSMIVPDTHRQTISFNEFIRENTNKIISVDDSAFDVNIATWCLIKDGSGTTVDNINWADLYEIPEQRVKWAKGKINVTTEANLLKDTGSTYTVFHKINLKGLHQSKTDIEVSELKLFPTNGYVVIMPQQMQNSGWSNTAIIKCNGTQAATNGVNLAFVNTKEEAEYLVEYMKKENFIQQALTHCGGMRNMTLGALQKISMDDYAY